MARPRATLRLDAPRRKRTRRPPSGVILPAQPTRRSWFVDADACGLRLVVDGDERGAARCCARCRPSRAPATCSATARRATTAPAQARARPTRSTARTRAAGPARRAGALDAARRAARAARRSIACASCSGSTRRASRAPVGSELRGLVGADALRARDERGRRSFARVASEPVRADGSMLPIRRRLVTIPEPRPIRVLRLAMAGATGAEGRPRPGPCPWCARSPRTAPTTRARSSRRRGS